MKAILKHYDDINFKDSRKKPILLVGIFDGVTVRELSDKPGSDQGLEYRYVLDHSCPVLVYEDEYIEVSVVDLSDIEKEFEL